MASINDLPEDIRQQVIIKQQQKEINALRAELSLYRKWCARPKILKQVIYHPVKSRDSQCLYGVAAWDEYVYE